MKANAVGKRINELRKAKNMTQEELALEANIDRSYIGRLITKNMNCTVKNLEKICDALGVTMAQFFDC
ncbi:MAG: helix-turn-helix domain-containing protein [Mycoplasmataceae bacterium]|jgi:transcriptional regulator with XRE-family HTH domain|nr:helix-turn-helix domain-containing protein [Mycoplasmataceae bacterium]